MSLNKDVLFLIALHLSTKDLQNFFCASKLCSSVNSDYFWSLKLQSDYSRSINDITKALSLYKRYVHFKSGKSRVISIPGNFTRELNRDWKWSPTDQKIFEKFLPLALEQRPKRGDTIKITNVLFVLPINYREDYRSIYLLFDGEKLVTMYTKTNKISHVVSINPMFQAIEEFAPDYWLNEEHSNVDDYCFCFNVDPYLDEIYRNEWLRPDGLHQSYFLSWNNIHYTLKYPDRSKLRWCWWFFKRRRGTLKERRYLICLPVD